MAFNEQFSNPAVEAPTGGTAFVETPAGMAGLGDRLGECLSEYETEREEELQHAFALREARQSLAALLMELPEECFQHVVGHAGPDSGRPHRWTLERLEAGYERLQIYAAAQDSAIVKRALELATEYKRELDRAREALVLSNLHIVPHIVKRFRNGTIPFVDLVQEGHVGLLKAVDGFDPGRGYRFSTYAYWWIRRSLTEAFANTSRLIRLPDSLREDLRAMRTSRKSLEKEHGRTPTIVEIAERMGVSPKKVKKLLDVVPDPASIEEMSEDHHEGWTSPLRASDADPLHATLGREMQRQAAVALELLDPRERRVIRLRFGFDRDGAMTLSQIGKQVGLSRERVRQIEREALRKIHAWADRAGVSVC